MHRRRFPPLTAFLIAAALLTLVHDANAIPWVSDRIEDEIEKQLEIALTGNVTIGRLGGSMVTGITLYDLKIYHPKSPHNRPLIEIPKAHVSYNLFRAAWERDIIKGIRYMEFENPTIRIDLKKNRAVTLQDLIPQAPPGSPNLPPPPFKGTLGIKNAMVFYSDPYGFGPSGIARPHNQVFKNGNGKLNFSGNPKITLEFSARSGATAVSTKGTLDIQEGHHALTLKGKGFPLSTWGCYLVPIKDLQTPRGTASFDITVRSLRGPSYFWKAPETIDGEVTIVNPDVRLPALMIRGPLARISFKPTSMSLEANAKEIYINGQSRDTSGFSGNGIIRVDFMQSIATPQITGSIRIDKGFLAGQPVTGRTAFRGTSTGFDITSLEGTIYGGTLAGSGRITIAPGGPTGLQGTMRVRNISISQLAQDNIPVAGRGSGTLTVDSRGSRTMIRGNLTLTSASLMGQKLTSLKMVASYDNGQWNLITFDLAGPGQALIKTTGTLDPQNDFKLFVSAKNLHVSNKQMLGGSEADVVRFTGALSGRLTPQLIKHPLRHITANGNVGAANIQLGPQQIATAEATFTHAKGRLDLSHAVAYLRPGSVSLSGTSGVGIPTSLAVTSEGLRVEDLGILRAFLPPVFFPIKGDAKFSAAFTGTIPADEQFRSFNFLKKMTLTTNSEISNGSIAEEPFELLEFGLVWKGRQVTLPHGRLKTKTSDVTIKGVVTNQAIESEIKGTLDLKNIQPILRPFGVVRGVFQVDGTLTGSLAHHKAIQLSARIKGDNFRYNSLRLDHIDGGMHYANGRFTFPTGFALEKDTARYEIDGAIAIDPFGIDLSVATGNGDVASAMAISNSIVREIAAKTALVGQGVDTKVTPAYLRLPRKPLDVNPEWLLYHANGVSSEAVTFIKAYTTTLERLEESEYTTQNVPYKARGKLRGAVRFLGTAKEISMRVEGEVKDGQFANYTFDSLTIKGAFKKGVIQIDDLAIHDEGGSLSAKGTINLGENVSVDITARNFPADILQAIPGSEIPLTGRIDMSATARGPINSPTAQASLRLTKGELPAISIDELEIAASVAEGKVTFSKMLLKKNGNTLAASGIYPIDPRGAIRLKATAQGKNIRVITDIFKNVRMSEGEGRLDITAAGTPLAPDIDGIITVAKGKIELDKFTSRLVEVEGDIRFQNSRAEIQKLQGFIEGELSREGRSGFAASGSIDFARLIAAQRIETAIAISDIDMNVNIANTYTGRVQLDALRIKGAYPVRKGVNIPTDNLLTLNGNVILSEGSIIKSESAEPPPLPFAYRYGMNVSIGRSVTFVQGESQSFFGGSYNPVRVVVEITGDNIVLSGTSVEPSIRGLVYFPRGYVHMYGREFTLVTPQRQEQLFGGDPERIRLNYAQFVGRRDDTGVLPILSLTAELKTRDVARAGETPRPILIVANLRGIPGSADPARTLQIQFNAYVEDTTKSPPEIYAAGKSSDEIRYLLLPEYLRDSLGAGGVQTGSIAGDIVADALSSRVQSLILRRIERELERSLGLETFTLEYNIGSNLRRAFGTGDTSVTSQTSTLGVGAMKGFSNIFFISVKYAQAVEGGQNLKHQQAINYELTAKLTNNVSLVYYQEPLTFAEAESPYYKATLNYNIKF